MENIDVLMNEILFFVLLCCVCVLMIALVMFSLDQNFVINSDTILDVQCLTTITVYAYIYSYFSENITMKSSEIGDIAYDSLWYEMPMNQQKALILIIGRSQRKFRLRGLGMVDCSLFTFSAVRISNT